VEQIEPALKPRQFKLEQLYLANSARSQLSKQRYEVFDKHTQVHVELFREENVPLETEEAKLSQQYQKLSGSLTVNFRGEEKTLVQMGRYLEEPDRALREEAWTLVAKRRLQEAEKFEEIFDQLVRLREQIAKNAGFSNYRDYAFRARARFDYTAQDCYDFHNAIEREVMPLVRDLQSKRRADLQLAALRPWDLQVDPQNQPPLHPFDQVETMVDRTQHIFDKLDRDLAEGFRLMNDLKLLDLANRKGKAPGATRDEDLYSYRHAPIEFCEVASMSMELLGNEYIDAFYNAADSNRARRDHLEGIIEIFPWIATVDAFQHWIYTHPGHSRAERTAAWLELMKRFGGDVEWSGFEEVRANLWHRQLHIFLHPFYYIEYGIAQLGALQVWANAKRDRAGALRDYQKALKLGGSRPLPELFQTAGCRFDFSAGTVKPLIELLRTELGKLSRSEEAVA
jgi:oligoendopeptidase F